MVGQGLINLQVLGAYAAHTPSLQGGSVRLGRNKEVYDAELYAIRQALQAFDERGERDQRYTIFADSTPAIDRVATDRLGSGQRFAVEATEACDRLTSRGNLVTIRWTPAHQGVDGNETADLYARGRPSALHAAEQAYLLETSFAHIMRLTTEARTSGTSSWIASHIRGRWGFRPPRGGRLRQELRHERKALAG